MDDIRGAIMNQPTKAGLLRFIDFAIQKGLVNGNTGGGWKAAVNKILEEYGEGHDVTSLDVKSEVIRFNNRHPGLLSPDSLNQYEKRVIYAIAEFEKYRNGPTTYQGPSKRASSNGKASEKRKPVVATKVAPPGPTQDPSAQPPQSTAGVATESSLTMPFPLRPNFLAQLVVPRDMNKDEASRLCAFIQAIAQDAPPQ